MDVHQSLNLQIFSDLENYTEPIKIPNVVNWDVYDFSNAKIGKVTDILLSSDTNEPRHIVMEYSSSPQPEGNEYILIPIGFISVNEDNKTVNIEYIEREVLDDAPKFDGRQISDEYEKKVTSFFTDYINNSPKKYGVKDVFQNTAFATEKGRKDSDLNVNTEPKNRQSI